MKKIIPALCALIAIAACNSNPTANTPPAQDTAGLAAFQQQRLNNVALNEIDTQAVVAAAKPATVRYVSTPRRARSTSTSSSSSGSGSTASNSGSGTTAAEAPAKKGISKTAKGAIIGGVAGAAGGALINKKNRGAGAVIGGILGAGAGAVIGNQADKKDGRH